MLIRNTGIYLGANLLNSITPFLLLPFLTRVLPPEDFVLLVMFTLVIRIFTALVGFSAQGSVTVYYFKMNADRFRNYISSCLVLVLIGFLLSCLIVLVFGSALERVTGIPERWLYAAVAVSALQVITLFMLIIWQATGAPIKYGIAQITRSVVEGGLVVLFIGFLAAGWNGKIWSTALVSISFGVFTIIYLKRENHIKIPENMGDEIRLALTFGVPLIPYIVGGIFSVTFDRFIIVSVISIEKAGVYMAGYQLAQLIQLGTQSFNKAFSPWLNKQLASNPNSAKKSRLVICTYACMAAFFIFSIIYGVVAPWFAKIFLGSSYEQAGDVVLVLGIGFAFRGCFYLVVNYIFFVEKTKILGVIAVVTGLIGLPITYVAVKKYGLSGAAFGFAFMQALTFFTVWYYSSKAYKMPWLQPYNSKLDNV